MENGELKTSGIAGTKGTINRQLYQPGVSLQAAGVKEAGKEDMKIRAWPGECLTMY